MRKIICFILCLIIISNNNYSREVFPVEGTIDYRFVRMISNLNQEHIEKSKNYFLLTDKIGISGILLYKDPVNQIIPEKIALSINRLTKTLTIWAYNKEEDNYNIPYKTILCSPNPIRTPIGVFHIEQFINGFHKMFGEDNYCQYCMRYKDHFLIHSPLFSNKNDHNSLKTYSYNGLGVRESGGCIRLSTGDAYWIFNNLDENSPVLIYDSDYIGPLSITPLESIPEDQIWDPTDPHWLLEK